MALLIVYDAATLFRSRRIDVRSRWGFLREREIRGLSSIFGAARKYGSGWIGQVILIEWKCSATLTVKLNYAPNKNSTFFLLQDNPNHPRNDNYITKNNFLPTTNKNHFRQHVANKKTRPSNISKKTSDIKPKIINLSTYNVNTNQIDEQ